jgi:hypothetical protein
MFSRPSIVFRILGLVTKAAMLNILSHHAPELWVELFFMVSA